MSQIKLLHYLEQELASKIAADLIQRNRKVIEKEVRPHQQPEAEQLKVDKDFGGDGAQQSEENQEEETKTGEAMAEIEEELSESQTTQAPEKEEEEEEEEDEDRNTIVQYISV